MARTPRATPTLRPLQAWLALRAFVGVTLASFFLTHLLVTRLPGVLALVTAGAALAFALVALLTTDRVPGAVAKAARLTVAAALAIYGINVLGSYGLGWVAVIAALTIFVVTKVVRAHELERRAAAPEMRANS